MMMFVEIRDTENSFGREERKVCSRLAMTKLDSVETTLSPARRHGRHVGCSSNYRSSNLAIDWPRAIDLTTFALASTSRPAFEENNEKARRGFK